MMSHVTEAWLAILIYSLHKAVLFYSMTVGNETQGSGVIEEPLVMKHLQAPISINAIS